MNNQSIVVGALAFLLVACGGGSGGGNNGSDNTPSATYKFMTPALGAQETYAETSVDNLNNTTTTTIVSNVTAVNSDGSYSTYLYNQANYLINLADYNFNNVGQETWQADGPPLVATSTTSTSGETALPPTCVISPSGAGAPSPLNIGETWSLSFTSTACSLSELLAGPISFTQTGELVDSESITVPAGTFTAYRFQSTLIHTTSTGTTVTETATTWRNASNTSEIIKRVKNYTYSGTAAATGSVVSVTDVLQNFAQLDVLHVKVNGQTVANVAQGSPSVISVKAGSTIEVDSDTAVSWLAYNNPGTQVAATGNTFSVGGVSIQETTAGATSTVWTANTSVTGAFTGEESFSVGVQIGNNPELNVFFNLTN